MPVYQSICKELLMTFEIASELQQSLSLLAFLNSGTEHMAGLLTSWADSSCSFNLLCDRPVQIELIASEFPLACHIRQILTWFLTAFFPNSGQLKGTQNQGEVRIYQAGLYQPDWVSAWIKHHPTDSLKINPQPPITIYKTKPTRESSTLPFLTSKYEVAKWPAVKKKWID